MSRYLGSFIALWLLFLATAGTAQNVYSDPELNKPLRIEIPVGSDNETYRVIPCMSDGMLIFFQSTETSTENLVKWYFIFYDRNFQKQWTKAVPLGAEMTFADSYSGNDTLSLFFQSEGKGKGSLPGFQVLRVIPHRGTFVLNNGDLPENATLAMFRVIGRTCFAGLNIKGEQAKLMILDLPTGKQDFVTLTGAMQTCFSAMEVTPDGAMVNLVVRKQLTRRFWDYYFVKISGDGRFLGETLMATMTPERQLSETGIYSISPTEQLLSGTYVLTSSVTDQQHQQGTSKATGFFTALISGLTEKNTGFTNFLDFKSADAFLSERDIISLRKKAMKKNRISTEYSTDLNMLIHNMVKSGDQYILLGEAYYLQFHSESFTDFDFYGRPYNSSYSVFDGYRFTNAIVAGYDADGNLLWDNSMEIRNLLSNTPDPKVTMIFDGDKIILAFLSEGKIGYKIIQGGNTVEKTDYTPLELLLPDDRLIHESKSHMIQWYDHYFICYGYQEIKNLSISGNATKLVFFCNKVQFE